MRPDPVILGIVLIAMLVVAVSSLFLDQHQLLLIHTGP